MDMTILAFDEAGVDVEYQGTTFRLERDLIESATDKTYWDVTDHEVLKLVDPDPPLQNEPRRVGDILR